MVRVAGGNIPINQFEALGVFVTAIMGDSVGKVEST